MLGCPSLCPYSHSDMSASASHRFEFRIRQESKQRIEHAANLVHESTSDFVRAAAERRADEVLSTRSRSRAQRCHARRGAPKT